MSATRKILLAISLLLALLGLFKVYDLATRAGSSTLDLDRNKAELRALEADEQPANGLELDEQERRERIATVRAWTIRDAEEAAREREERQARWRNAILMVLFAGGLATAVVVMGRKDAPRALVRLGQLRPGVIVAGLVGLLAGTLLIAFTQDLIEEQEEVTLAEQSLDEVQSKLKGFDYDASGNIRPEQRSEFESLMSTARYAPERVTSARGRRTLAAFFIMASTVALGLSAYFGRRSWLRSRSSAGQGSNAIAAS